ncbi:hypothetical protein DL766_005673 [Monosporascus sp. MC13-8B]|uniref:Cation-transporting P-type ATPase C-terminal domain-containing protein n=1 Tax=Monosporascus cannonballus TaxID=155416 RepID=A0ABY0H647_9PEZI|nr:hypothetical protein DL762_005373 [Monosporascus cannonballus]RYP28842.1 hypothetical protein DL766_005673 [Monosporascus sp. MC13-8B]
MTLVLIMAMTVGFGIEAWIEGVVIAAVIILNVVVVVEAVSFETDEALLTGESLPVRKDEKATSGDATGPGDRLNVAYRSSTVTKGRAKGIVFATGTYTEIRAIADALRKKDSKNLSRLAVLLFFIAVIFAIVVLGANRFEASQEVVTCAIATGLSMIPASLVIVLTITMAAGTKQIVQRNVIVRNLRGRVIAKRAWIPAMGTYTVDTSSEPFNPTAGGIYFDSRQPHQAKLKKDAAEQIAAVQPSQLLPDSKAALADYLRVASLANLATNRLKLTRGHNPEWTQIAEFPFDSDVKRMSVIFKNERTGDLSVFTKGAVERVIGTCVDYCEGDSHDTVAMMDEFRQEITNNTEALAGMGLRVLALASRRYDGRLEKGDEADRNAVESDLTFRGLIGLHDPPRTESAPAVRSCHEAGIAVHMLTGGHPETAKAAAIEVGILRTRIKLVRRDVADAMVMTASKLAATWRRMPQMWYLPTTNFASIVAAIEEGRRIFDNIQKFVLHVLAENIAQAGTLLIGLAFKDARVLSVLPLSPVEIAWVIMIMSGMPDMGLGFEQAAPGRMSRPPQSLKAGIFDMEFLVEMVVYGVWIAALRLASFCLVLYGFGDGNLGENCNEYFGDRCGAIFRARATTFACITWLALLLSWEMVDRRRSFFRMQPGSKKYFTQWMHDVWRNKLLFWAIVMVLKHTGISWEWGIVFVAAALFLAGVEAWKFAKRLFFRSRLRRDVGAGASWNDQDIEHRAFAQYASFSASSENNQNKGKVEQRE